MINELKSLISSSINKTNLNLNINKDIITISHTKNKKFGDFTTNIAMVLAAKLKQNPSTIAQNIVNNLAKNDIIAKVVVAKPGFINFYLYDKHRTNIINTILSQQQYFGTSNFGRAKKVLIEFVSANPTGPLHIGHGRSAAFGNSLVRLLKAVGFEVVSEYYINDAGRQIDILCVSVYLSYIKDKSLPLSGYKGNYINDIANKLSDIPVVDIKNNAYPDSITDNGDKEKHIDDLIANAKQKLAKHYNTIMNTALDYILALIKKSLAEFRVNFDNYFSEQSLAKNVITTVNKLEQNGFVYTKNNTKWFKSTDFSDEKDRVVVRNNGLTTYFASDISYHEHKFSLGYDKIINIWGADHHGYINRMKAAMTALNFDASKLDILLVQFANLYKNNKRIPMSTRGGEFITLKQLYSEIGVDASRFFYILRKNDQHLDFDLDLAKSQSHKNPVFYIQYAYARISSVLKKNKDPISDNNNFELLIDDKEITILKELRRFPDILIKSAASYEVHQLAYYLKNIATAFHSYYNSCEFLAANHELKSARLKLISAIKIVIGNGMGILGVTCPDKM